MPIDDRPRAKLGSLEVGRGIAALAVVMHHAGLAGDAFTSLDYGGLFHWGMYGVDFFFVLSGFIIFHVHQYDRLHAGAAPSFLIKRLRRIYTPYLPVTIVMIAAYLALPGLSQGDREWGWFTSLTLLPSDAPPALSVAWTLVFEMIFYLFFLSFFFTRHFWTLVLIWSSVIIANYVFKFEWIEGVGALKILFDPIIFEFFAGMIAARVFSSAKPQYWYAPLIAAVGGALVHLFVVDGHRATLTLVIAPLVLSAAMAEERFEFEIPSSLLLFGAASYAIYLVHNPLQSLIARLFRGADNWLLSFTACCVAGVAFGILYHLIYERPALRWLSRRARAPYSASQRLRACNKLKLKNNCDRTSA